jgi:hypothetical protein
MQIERQSGLTPDSFIYKYLELNSPVIVLHAMSGWKAVGKWTPEYFERMFGEFDIQVYNDLFDLVNITSLAEYLHENFGKSEDVASQDYVRWYTKLKSFDFVWADEAFERFKDDWDHPDFLPSTSYAIPFCPATQRISVVDTLFPYRGLFISGRGAKTRLHRDPWTSEALLCQFYGEKRIILYSPDQEVYLVKGKNFVNIEDPDQEEFPLFPNAKPTFEDVLRPGEILFIPGGWFHDVTSITDSISITWNFVHATKLDRLCDYIMRNPYDDELEIVRFFLSSNLPSDASVNEIVTFLRAAAVI